MGERPVDGDAAGELPCSLTLRAEAWAVGVVRSELSAWLVSVDWPQPQQTAIVVAVSEAVENVVQHAYPPVEGAAGRTVDRSQETVSVDAVVVSGAQLRRVRVVVGDCGSWNPLSVLNTESVGLQLMNELMDEVAIRRGVPGEGAGSEVMLLSAAVPRPRQ